MSGPRDDRATGGPSLLLKPLEIGSVKVKNRVALTAHGDRFAENGIVTERLISHYKRRAQGGVGLIVALGSAPVHAGFSGGSNPALVSLWNEDNDIPLTRMAEEIHAHGAILLGQATHRGQRERPSGNPVVIAPSAYPGTPPNGSPAVLRTEQIKELVDAYAAAAKRLDQAGFDGIQVTASPSHLIENFWSPVLNRRTDAYGGALENRLRFGVEVLQAIDRAVKKDFLISFRMSGDLLTDDLGLTKDELFSIALTMGERCRIDLYDITGGSGLDAATHAGAVPTDDFPIECYNALAKRVRNGVTSPVLVAGRIMDPESGERTLHNGDSDLVGMTRAILADPDLVLRLETDERSRIRPCIAINEGCRRVVAGHQVACSVNPEVGNGALGEPYASADQARRVLVIGGGPGGMEAARVAAERGHLVTLTESSSLLGGQMVAATKTRSRPHLGGHIAWLKRELERLSIDVQLSTTADVESIRNMLPDVTVFATGAQNFLPDAARPLKDKSVTDVDVLSGDRVIARDSRVVVYDAEGYHRGGTIAAFAAEAGAIVELVTPYNSPAEHLETPNKRAMYRELSQNNVSALSGRRFTTVDSGRMISRDIWTNELHEHADADLFIFVGFYQSVTFLHSAVRAELPALTVHLIGDARAPRLLRNAVLEGVEAGMKA